MSTVSSRKTRNTKEGSGFKGGFSPEFETVPGSSTVVLGRRKAEERKERGGNSCADREKVFKLQWALIGRSGKICLFLHHFPPGALGGRLRSSVLLAHCEG